MDNRYKITGDLDLLGDWLDAKGYTEEAGLCTQAMDLIHKQIDELKKLQKTLKPFADILEKHGGFERVPIDIAILINAAESWFENNKD